MNKYELDDIDLKLISLLEKDGRTSYASLAKALSVSTGTARNRLQRLLDQKIVQIAAYPNPNRSDSMLRAFVGFNIEADSLKEAARELIQHRSIRYAAISTGSFEIVALTEFNSKQEMLEFLTDTVGKIKGIKAIQSFVLLSVLKSLGTVIYPLENHGSDNPLNPVKSTNAGARES